MMAELRHAWPIVAWADGPGIQNDRWKLGHVGWELGRPAARMASARKHDMPESFLAFGLRIH